MTSEQPTWWATRLLIGSTINGVLQDDGLVEERVVLFQAGSAEAAEKAAVHYGKSEEHSYSNEAGETVAWYLMEVQEVAPVLDSPQPQGWEVLSRFLRRDELPAIREDS